MRALVVGDDDARGLLAAVRSLGANGWHVGVVTPSRRSLAASSRWCSAWHPLGADVVASVGAVSASYDVVLPGGDAEVSALSERRDEVGCVVPYGSRESVRCVLDKVSLSSAAVSAGLSVPRTFEADDVSGTVVVKSRSHVAGRVPTVVTDDPAAVRTAVASARAAGAEPVVQECVSGPLLALSVVLWDGEVVAAVQQRSSGLWPPGAGISTRAETVRVDSSLQERVAALLRSIGWAGLAQAQFLERADGPVLIDVNGRCYGSLALAAAAGVDLAAVWASAALGLPYVAGPAVPGVRYQWLYGDVRRSWRESRSVLPAAAYARGAAHSVWDRRDPRPGVAYGASLARLAAAR
ncbi:MAG TPA: ATP-grasp domain-containing protein [Frankiaceae bacterium]|nr:ATP-grasp domain-containing protein [Frankiaceae bacterium]